MIDALQVNDVSGKDVKSPFFNPVNVMRSLIQVEVCLSKKPITTGGEPYSKMR